MRIIPVIDLKGGVVVRGIAGRRDEYRPIVSRLCDDPSPASVARGLRETFGFDECYVADLDALVYGRPDAASCQDVELAGMRACVDAGVGKPIEPELQVVDRTITPWVPWRAVLSLESLPEEGRYTTLPSRDGTFIFSLDLMHGQPLTVRTELKQCSSEEIAARFIEQGVRCLIVLDLAGVGVGQGVPTLDLCRRLRAMHPDLELISGGGVRGLDDLHALRDAGCNAALVASALHDGRLTPEMLRFF